jgi:predicted lipoprotein
MRLAALLFAGLLAAAPAWAQEGGPASSPPSPEALRAITQGAADDYILQAHANLEAAAAELSASVSAFCAGPATSSADEVKAKFGVLLEKWAGVDFLDFGPMTRDNRASRFAFWPDPHGTAERQLRQLVARPDPQILEPGELAKQSAAIQGLPALEVLLHGVSSGILLSPQPDPTRCTLAQSVAGNLAAIAKAANAEWQGDDGWRALMLSPGPDNPVYLDPNEPMADILRSLLQGLEILRDQRIQPARGPAPDTAKASRAPYWRSGSTIAYWRASADALFRYAMAARLTSLAPEKIGNALEQEARFEFRNLKNALGAVEPPLDRALIDPQPREKLGYAMIVLQSLRDIYRNQLPGAAGFSPGFNALDGD